MRRAIYPGSFDPVTNGHVDIIERGAKLFDEIVIAILQHPEKKSMFTVAERKQMLEAVAGSIKSVGCKLVVDSFEGLLVHYAVKQEANAILRGIRAVSDYEYELQMALMNRKLEPSIETVFMMATGDHSFISSRLVKEVFTHAGDIAAFVPPSVLQEMKRK
jgi:pantetheine-phosphate adenylyltransferase